jgi:hypothetical protein
MLKINFLACFQHNPFVYPFNSYSFFVGCSYQLPRVSPRVKTKGRYRSLNENIFHVTFLLHTCKRRILPNQSATRIIRRSVPRGDRHNIASRYSRFLTILSTSHLLDSRNGDRKMQLDRSVVAPEIGSGFVLLRAFSRYPPTPSSIFRIYY